MERRTEVPALGRKTRRGEGRLLYFRSGKSRDKEFDDKELFTRQIRRRGFQFKEHYMLKHRLCK